mmetsp:Transcript_14857/g.41057  ORF Transcript_14857/g.41057 Transcript_14857/m.41057 type:complete len:280 (-) Transcript_14857:16-855(-)
MCWGSPPGPAPPVWWPTPAPTPPPASLLKPSNAPLLTFYMYRVQSEENWPLTNKNTGNIAGMLWYLHNEVVWHSGGRHGTYFTHPVTRLVKFKIQMRATQPLYDLGMNFGVVNTMDSNKCTGPFMCDNLQRYGGTVGCETWERGNPNNFPHHQWDDLNSYPGATWYSLPEAGHCPEGVTPTGEGSCVYSYEYKGEITIDQLEGIKNFTSFTQEGGREYNPKLDDGVHLSFWKYIKDERFCQWRIDQAKRLFKEKYPWMEELVEPACDFNKFKFYPDRHV